MTLNPGRMMESSERKPCVVGVVMVVRAVSESFVSELLHVLASNKSNELK